MSSSPMSSPRRWRRSRPTSGRDGSPRYSPDGRHIAYLSEPVTAPPIGDGTPRGTVAQQRVMVYDVTTKQTRDATGSLAVEPGAPYWSADGRRLLFATGDRAYVNAFELDLATGTATTLTSRRTLQLGTFSADGSRVAFTMDSPTAPAEVFVADARFATPVKLTDLNPQAKDFAIGASEVVTWKSRDGLEVEGVLLKPVGYDPAKRYPLLVVAHGGPAGAHLDNYRVGGLEGGQLWAGMGWAVFYPNPRGSTQLRREVPARQRRRLGRRRLRATSTAASTRWWRAASPIRTSSPTSAGATAAT